MAYPVTNAVICATSWNGLILEFLPTHMPAWRRMVNNSIILLPPTNQSSSSKRHLQLQSKLPDEVKHRQQQSLLLGARVLVLCSAIYLLVFGQVLHKNLCTLLLLLLLLIRRKLARKHVFVNRQRYEECEWHQPYASEKEPEAITLLERMIQRECGSHPMM